MVYQQIQHMKSRIKLQTVIEFAPRPNAGGVFVFFAKPFSKAGAD